MFTSYFFIVVIATLARSEPNFADLLSRKFTKALEIGMGCVDCGTRMIPRQHLRMAPISSRSAARRLTSCFRDFGSAFRVVNDDDRHRRIVRPFLDKEAEVQLPMHTSIFAHMRRESAREQFEVKMKQKQSNVCSAAVVSHDCVLHRSS
jgi:hypothetical protein